MSIQRSAIFSIITLFSSSLFSFQSQSRILSYHLQLFGFQRVHSCRTSEASSFQQGLAQCLRHAHFNF